MITFRGDTAWQLFTRASYDEVDAYCQKLVELGFDGFWSFLLHHPAAAANNVSREARVPLIEGRLILSPEYVDEVRRKLNIAQSYGLRVGVGLAWGNTYLPNGVHGDDLAGRLNLDTSGPLGWRARTEFGDHPAVDHWILGGDIGREAAQNQDLNIWREMADELGTNKPRVFHTGTRDWGGQLQYGPLADVLDVIAIETGHTNTQAQMLDDLLNARNTYEPLGLDVWSGESRYYGLSWAQPPYPTGVQMAEDARAVRDSGVSGALYGRDGRWQWNFTNRQQVLDSFNDGETVFLDIVPRSENPTVPVTPEQPPMPEPDVTPLQRDILNNTLPGQAHDWPLPLPSWDWAINSKLNDAYNQMDEGSFTYAEARGALFRDNTSGLTIRLQMTTIDYWSYVPGRGWRLRFQRKPQGAFMGTVGTIDNPFANSKGNFTADAVAGTNNYTIDWPANKSRALHFWAGMRQEFEPGQTAELVTVSITRSIANERIVAGAAADYYSTTGGQGISVPGPGIQKYQNVPEGPGVLRSAWLTVKTIPRAQVSERTLLDWMNANGLPDLDRGTTPVEPPTPEPPTPGDGMHVFQFTARGTTGSERIVVDDWAFDLSATAQGYSIPFDGTAPRIEFTNDGRDENGQDRNVIVESVAIDGLDIPLEHPLVRSLGNWQPDGTGCGVERSGPGGWLHCNGWIDVHNAWVVLRNSEPMEPPVVEPPTECPEFNADDFKAFVADLGACGSLELLLEALGVEA